MVEMIIPWMGEMVEMVEIVQQRRRAMPNGKATPSTNIDFDQVAHVQINHAPLKSPTNKR